MKTTNSFRSKFFALVLALVASVSSFAKDGYPDFQVDGLYYSFLEGDSVQVTFLRPTPIPTEVAADTSNKKYAPAATTGAEYGHLTEIVIPSTVTYEEKTYHVIRIGHGSFLKCVNLQHVDLPTSIKSIGVAAFWSCHSLSSITLNEGLESIEEHALWDCPTLKEVSLPSTLKSLGQKVFGESTSLSKVICKAAVPPVVENDLLTGTDNYNASIIPNATLYVPAESLEAYTTAAAWKDFGQILPITWSEECYEYRDFNLGIELFPRKSSLVYTLYHTDDRTIEPPYVDSVWILDPELDKQNPLHVHTLYAQPGDTINLSFLEKNKHYILKVHINECQMSRVFTHRVVKWEYKWCNKWNVLRFDGMRFDETAKTSHYQLGQDTVIGDYTYSKFIPGTYVRFTEDWKVYVYHEGFDDNDPYTVDLPTGEYLAYDFSAKVGDTLEVFSGIPSYTTEQCVVYDVQTDPETNLRTIMLHPLCVVDGDGTVGVSEEEITWLEGVGSPNGFLISTPLPGGASYVLLCAYKDDELKYTGSYYERFGCEYNAGVVSDDLFPTLSGLQRTICREYCEQADNKTRMEQFTNLTTRTETVAPYIYCSPFLLREKDNKIMIYSRTLNKDLVLYDFNLQVGDSLPMLYIDFFAEDDWIADRDMEIWCVVDYHKDLEGNILPADTLIVTDVSMITLLDGKEYKKWTFNNGMEYVEGIGSFGNGQWSGDLFQLIANKDVPTCLLDEHLVCASKNGQLLYQMDDTEMERLGAECLCEYNAEQNPKDLFPTLTGLQRTTCLKNINENEVGTVWGSRSYLMQETQTTTIDGKQYIVFGDEYDRFALREENNKILLYSSILKKDLVLYDFTLEVGDSLPALYYELRAHDTMHQWLYIGDIVDYNKDDDGTILPAETFVVTDISTITLLDGKEYKKWTFDNGMEYVEGIGSFGTSYAWNDFYQLIANGPLYSDVFSQHLVCASKNGQLLYKMDDAEMEQLETECLCEYNAEQKPEDLFPTLWGLQRTDIEEHTTGDGKPYLSNFEEYVSIQMNGKLYLSDGRNYLREENNQVLFCCPDFEIYEDIVLYDWTLEIGDTLPHNKSTVHTESDFIVTNVSTVTLLNGKKYKKWTLACGYEYIEGIGAINGEGYGHYLCLQSWMQPGTYIRTSLVCATRNGQLLYKMDDAEMERLGTECLCEYNAEQKPEDLFPTLWGLQRTSCDEWYDGCGENKSYLFAPKEVKEINGKLYLKCGGVFLREEDSKVLIYSFPYEKDFVLYDYTLEVGGTLQNLGIDIYSFPELEYAAVVDYIAYEDYDVETDEFIIKKEPLGSKRVQEVSTITLLDGKEYKRWLFGNDWENGNYYIEGIGNVGGSFGGDYIDIANPYGTPIPTCYLGERLVCASRNGKLLYQMDDTEMERLGAECLCEYNDGPKKDNAKDGKIGGRPTPTQWNMLEVETKEMDGTPTILRAETFSYTLENDSIVANNKTYYQLARQSTRDTAITKSVVGALHFSEDEGNRVYFLCDDMEYLLYDFTAEPGDSIEIFAGINNYPQATTYTHVVTGKDTLENGACRMILEVVFPNQTDGTNLQKVWLAGLGSIDGIVHNSAQQLSNARSAETESSVMLCAWREDSCLYTTNHPDFDTYGCVYNQDPTAVETIPTSQSSYQKFIRDGQLIILQNGRMYNVIGLELK